MNRPKQIGTAAETAVRRALLSKGYTELDAHRNVLTGSEDQGDVWLRHPTRGLIVFEVKGGKTAKAASHNKCLDWVNEALTEAVNARANAGILVTQRAGVGAPRAGQWWCYLTLSTLLWLTEGSSPALSQIVVRMTLDEFLDLL